MASEESLVFRSLRSLRSLEFSSAVNAGKIRINRRGAPRLSQRAQRNTVNLVLLLANVVRGNRYLPGCVAIAGDRDAPRARRQWITAHALGPFDNDHSALVGK